jgi:AcrR family transcriptional regulator
MTRPGFDPALVPDPFAPMLPMAGPYPAQQRSHHRQALRRALMLATTRRLLAQGHEHFTLRRVSEACGVTVQTIRNSFGRREDLLVSALNEHTSAIWRALGSFSEGPTLFLDLAQMYYHCAHATPDFLRAMVTTAIASNQPLATLQRHGITIKVEHLRAMARQGLLLPGVDVEALAAQITRLNTFMMYEWTMDGDAAELRRQMIEGNRLLLAGALQPAAAEALDRWVPFHGR